VGNCGLGHGIAYGAPKHVAKCSSAVRRGLKTGATHWPPPPTLEKSQPQTTELTSFLEAWQSAKLADLK